MPNRGSLVATVSELLSPVTIKLCETSPLKATARCPEAEALPPASGERGWIGDNPFIFLDTNFVNSLGWQPKLTIRDGVLRTLGWLQANPWVMEKQRASA